MFKFSLGRVVETSGVHNMRIVNDKFNNFVAKSFVRHCNGDWGDLDKEDKRANELALKNDFRLLSRYVFDGDIKIYIITEWDRSCTTILFSEEY